MNNFKNWMINKFDGEQSYFLDIANYGVDGGFSGLVYTNECVELYNQFKGEIWEALAEDAEEMGYSNAMELVSTFQRKDMLNDPDQFKNLLVWYMAERVAREIQAELEEQED